MAGYGDDTEFAAWLTARGYTLPDSAPDAAVLRERGSVYIDGTYAERWPGTPTGGIDQERAWPRTGATDVYGNAIASNAVPTRVEHASYEAAWIEAGKPGSLGRTYTAAQDKVLTQVDKIKWEVVGDASGKGANVPVSTVIEGLLWPLLTSRIWSTVLAV